MKISMCGSPLSEHQCCRFSRNTAKVTPKIIYFYYQKIYLQDQSIQKINYLILKKTSLLNTYLLDTRCSALHSIIHLICIAQPLVMSKRTRRVYRST